MRRRRPPIFVACIGGLRDWHKGGADKIRSVLQRAAAVSDALGLSGYARCAISSEPPRAAGEGAVFGACDRLGSRLALACFAYLQLFLLEANRRKTNLLVTQCGPSAGRRRPQVRRAQLSQSAFEILSCMTRRLAFQQECLPVSCKLCTRRLLPLPACRWQHFWPAAAFKPTPSSPATLCRASRALGAGVLTQKVM